MDLVDLYRTSIAAFAATVSQVGTGQWNAPTPCSDWNVRALVNHVVSEQRWSVPLLAGATVAEVGERYDGDLLGSDPMLRAAEAAEDATAAASATGATERTVHLSFGDTPAAEYLSQLLADHLIHGWDLAAAIGADRRLDPRLVAVCLDWFAERESLYRDAGVIAPRVSLAPAAGDQDRLLAAFGRDPAWQTSS